MWVFDGEQWTEEGSELKGNVEQPVYPVEAMLPDLQVIDIVQIPKTNPVPPMPLP